LDGDGDQDLILTTGVGGTAWIVITDSLGGPPRFQSLRTGATRPGTPALGDFDGDGDLDLAVTESIQLPNFGTPAIYLVENAGAGVFRPGLDLAFGEFPELPEWIDVADLDGDGDNEILVTDRIRGRLGIYFNQTRPPKVSSADQDGDGALSLMDLLVLGKSWYMATEP
jgi:hypothetical protein